MTNARHPAFAVPAPRSRARRLAWVAGVLAVVGCALWAAAPDGDGAPPPPSRSSLLSRPDAPEPAVAGAAPAQAPARRERVGAPSPAAVAAEFTDFASWQEQRRATAPGEVEVLVLRARRPVVGARVRLWSYQPGHFAAARTDAALREGHTGPDGRVRWSGLAGGDYTVRADDADEHVVTECKAEQADGGRTTLALFGSAVIEGTVLDGDGNPQRGRGVTLAASGSLPVRGARTTTAADGTFRFTGVHGGQTWVALERAEGAWTPDDERLLWLDPGERARVVFGGPVPRGVVHGQVVDGELRPLPGARLLRAWHAEHDDARRVRVDVDGSFRVALPRGRWMFAPADDAQALATADVGDAAVPLDVRWPGIRLLVAIECGPDVDTVDVGQCTTLRSAATGHVQSEGTFTIAARPCVQWTGLAPGEHVVQLGGGFQFTDARPEGVHLVLTSAPVQRVVVNVRR